MKRTAKHSTDRVLFLGRDVRQTKQEVPQKCMMEFLISQRWLTHQGLIAVEQFWFIMFFPL